MDLQALADFNLVAEQGGFGAAARASARAKATLSRKVRELEEELGVRLIERGARSLRLTDDGRALHERTRGALADIAEARQMVGAEAAMPHGRLRVSAPIVLSHVALARVAADFSLRYPEIELELIAEDRKADPVEEDFDLVIRVDPSPDERLVGRRILEDRRLLVAAPQFRLPSGDGVTSIRAVDRIGTSADMVWQIETTDGVRRFRPRSQLRYSSFLMIREALVAGAGFALAPRLMVSDDIDAGRLVSFGAASGPPVEIWILQNSRRLTSRRSRLFMDAVVAHFRTDIPPVAAEPTGG